MGDRYNFFQIEASFKKYLIAENVSAVTLKNYCSDLRSFFSWIKFAFGIDGLALSDIPNYINQSSLSAYAEYLKKSSESNMSYKRRFSTMRKFCSFCMDQKWITTNPAKLHDVSSKRDEKQIVIQSFLRSIKENGTNVDLDYYNNVLVEFLNVQ